MLLRCGTVVFLTAPATRTGTGTLVGSRIVRCSSSTICCCCSSSGRCCRCRRCCCRHCCHCCRCYGADRCSAATSRRRTKQWGHLLHLIHLSLLAAGAAACAAACAACAAIAAAVVAVPCRSASSVSNSPERLQSSCDGVDLPGWSGATTEPAQPGGCHRDHDCLHLSSASARSGRKIRGGDSAGGRRPHPVPARHRR